MLSKCANPACSARFLYLHEGKVFKFATSRDPQGPRSRVIEYFWLCASCAQDLTVVFRQGTVTLVPRGSESSEASPKNDGL
jgi:hypothetical protein